MNVARTHLVLTALTCFWACGGGTRPVSGVPMPGRGSSSIVTMEELATLPATQNLYDALRAIRPGWFRMYPVTLRPAPDTAQIVVYLDESRLGGPEMLLQVDRSAVKSVRHYTPSDAQIRWGLGHPHGAIQVITSR